MARTARRSTSIARRASSGARVVVQRAAPVVRRVGSAASVAAASEKHTMVALLAAGAAGYARREGMLDQLPHIDALGVEGTYGALAWAVGKYTRNRMASHLATGLLCIAVNRLAAEGGGSGTP